MPNRKDNRRRFQYAAACLAYDVVAIYRHDANSYTQGIVFRSPDELLESTGLYGHSTIRRVSLYTGMPREIINLPSNRFGEGITVLHEKVYQLTWESMIAYVYDSASLQLIDQLQYGGEGWGLTTDGNMLIMSNGSDLLTVRDPTTFEPIQDVSVRYQTGVPISKLNELEYYRGSIFANIYQSDVIIRIAWPSGVVTHVLDLTDLLPGLNVQAKHENVLNGIAVDPANGHLLVTGKRWPKLFRLALSSLPG